MAEAVSFDPNEAVEGGGGLVQQASDVKLTFECVAYDYNGSVAVPVPAIHMHGEFEDSESGEDVEFDEYYSMGDASKFRAAKDGSHFETLAEGAKPTKTCKGMQLISSIINANGGENIVGANIKDLDGLVADVERKPDMERPGLAATNKAGRGRTILLISAIKSLPGEAPKKGNKAKVAAAKAAPAAAGKPAGKKNALKDKTYAAIVAVIEGAGGSVPVEDLPTFLFRKNKKDPEVKAMTELAADEDFLGQDDAPFEVDGEDLKLKEE